MSEVKVKMKKHSHGKDLPRYKVIVAYEKEFKMQYAKMLSDTLTFICKRLGTFGK